MAFPYILLAAQAAGIGANLYANRSQSKLEAAGYSVDEAVMRNRMEQESLAAQQENLSDIRNLQETLATQRAIFSARGQSPSQGTAGTIQEASIRATGENIKTRGMNTGFRKNYLESLGRLKRVESQTRKAERGAQLLGTSLNMVDFNTLFGKATASAKPKKELL